MLHTNIYLFNEISQIILYIRPDNKYFGLLVVVCFQLEEMQLDFKNEVGQATGNIISLGLYIPCEPPENGQIWQTRVGWLDGFNCVLDFSYRWEKYRKLFTVKKRQLVSRSLPETLRSNYVVGDYSTIPF